MATEATPPLAYKEKDYAGKLDELKTLFDTQKIDEDTYKSLKRQLAESEYSGPSFNINEFSDLLGRLEGSKMRQQRQKSVEGRRDIFAGGLAGMMSNF